MTNKLVTDTDGKRALVVAFNHRSLPVLISRFPPAVTVLRTRVWNWSQHIQLIWTQHLLWNPMKLVLCSIGKILGWVRLSSITEPNRSQSNDWKFWALKPENEGGNLFSSDAAIDGWVEPQLLWCRKLPVSTENNICFSFSALGFSLFHLAHWKSHRRSSSSALS